MKNDMLRTGWKTVCILCGGIVLGALLLIGAYYLPLTPGNHHVRTSVDILEREGWYPTLPLVENFSGEVQTLNPGGVLDNFTDSIMITTASRDPAGHPLYQAINMASAVLEDGYSYYWHGYVAVLRPLLLLFDYGEIRVFNELFQILLVALQACILYRKKGLRWAVFALTSYGLLMPMALAFSLQYSWVFYISMLGSLLIIQFSDFWSKNHRIYLLFLVLGILTSYFDLLTYPLFTWGMPMIWWILMNRSEETERQRLWDVVGCGLFWILGYGGMWAGKWLLGQLILHKSVIATAWGEVQYRAGLMEGTVGSDVSHLVPLQRNWVRFGSIQNMLMLAPWLLWFLFMLWRRRGRISHDKSPAMLLIACSSPVWYFVLHNHTYAHESFTFRIITVSFCALLALMISSVEGAPAGAVPGAARKVIPFAIIIIALVSSFRDREPYFTHNGYCESRQIALEEGQTLTQTLHPDYNNLQYLNVGLKAEGALQGSFTVEICSGDQTIFSARLPMDEVTDSGFYPVSVDIRLDTSTEYALNIYTTGCVDTTGYVSVTAGGEQPITEMGRLLLDDIELGGQIIGGIGYYRLPGIPKLMLNFLTLVGIFWAVYLICSLVEETLRLKKAHTL